MPSIRGRKEKSPAEYLRRPSVQPVSAVKRGSRPGTRHQLTQKLNISTFGPRSPCNFAQRSQPAKVIRDIPFRVIRDTKILAGLRPCDRHMRRPKGRPGRGESATKRECGVCRPRSCPMMIVAWLRSHCEVIVLSRIKEFLYVSGPKS